MAYKRWRCDLNANRSKGEDIESKKEYTFKYERRFPGPIHCHREFSEDIYQSSKYNPSTRKVEAWEEDGFFHAIVVNFRTPVWVSKLPKRLEGDNIWYVLEYDLEVEISGASITISAKWLKDKSVEVGKGFLIAPVQ